MGFRPIDPSELEESPSAFPAGFRPIDPSELAVSKEQQIENLLGQDDVGFGKKTLRLGLGAVSKAVPFGDEIIAGGAALTEQLPSFLGGTGRSFSDAYGSRVEELRDYQEAADKTAPVASTVLDISSGVAAPLPGIISGAKGAKSIFSTAKGITPALGNIFKSAGVGATYAAGSGFGKGEGGIENRIDSALDSAKMGAIFGAGTQGASELIQGAARKAGPKLKEIGQDLLRKSIGARGSDYAKSAKEAGVWDIKDDEVISRTKQALNELEDAGVFGKSRDPAKVLANVLTHERKLTTDVDALIRRADKAGVKSHPTFDNALNYIADGKVPADEVDKYIGMVEGLSEAIKKEGKGSPLYLQQQKIVAGNKYDPDDDAVSGFWRMLYKDLQTEIETKVPGVQKLNNELKKVQLAKPIVQRNLGTGENGTFFDSTKQWLRTSGGTLTTPTLIGTAIGGAAVGGPVGLIAGATLGAAASPKGRAEVGKLLKKSESLGSAGKAIQGNALRLTPSVLGRPENNRTPEKQAGERRRLESSSSLNSTTSSQNAQRGLFALSNKGLGPKRRDIDKVFDAVKGGKVDVKEVEKLIDSDPFDAAVYEIESSRNPKAKNPTSSAAGGFQLIKSMQKSLGVNDPYDLEQNYKGFQKLKAEHAAKFGNDPERLYMAHYLGAPVLSKYLKGGNLTDEEEAQIEHLQTKVLPRFREVYSKYADKAIKV